MATITGFNESSWGRLSGRRPGVYENRCWINIKFDDVFDGKTEMCISCCFLEPVDQEKYKKRKQQRCAKMRTIPKQFYLPCTFIRELPETEFWELDEVNNPDRPDAFIVASINYDYIDQLRSDNETPMPLYDLNDGIPGWYVCGIDHRKLSLRKRGNIWNFYHNEPLEFNSLEEEVDFYNAIGYSYLIPNPKTNLYVWSYAEAWEAVEHGIAHDIREDTCNRYNVYVHINNEIAEKISKAILTGKINRSPRKAIS